MSPCNGTAILKLPIAQTEMYNVYAKLQITIDERKTYYQSARDWHQIILLVRGYF